MSIRRQLPASANPSPPAPAPAPATIHPAAQDAWAKLISHPNSALLTHVPRPAVGAIGAGPGNAPKAARSEPQNNVVLIRQLIPQITSFFLNDDDEESYNTLCNSVTSLLSSAGLLNDDMVWEEVVQELHMPVPWYTRVYNYSLWQEFVNKEDGQMSARDIFRFYCAVMNTTPNKSNRSMIKAYRRVVWNEWTQRLYGHDEKLFRPSVEYDLNTMISSWCWVTKNLYREIPKVDQVALANSFFKQPMSPLYEPFMKTFWNYDWYENDAYIKVNYFVQVVADNLQEWEEEMEERRLMTNVENKKRTFEWMLLNMDEKYVGWFVDQTVRKVYRSNASLIKEDPDEARDIVLVYNARLGPAFKALKTWKTPDGYQLAINSVGVMFSHFVTYFINKVQRRGVNVSLSNAIMWHMRYILRSVLPTPFKLEKNVLGVEIPDFETVKRKIEMLMDPNTEHATFEEFAYEWPKSLMPIYPFGATQDQNM